MRTHCPLCDSNNVKTSFSKGAYTMLRCGACKTLFVGDELTEADLATFYSESYFEADTAAGEDERGGYPSYMAAQENLLKGFRQRMGLLRQCCPAGRLLDAGAAYGTFLRVASESYDCVGLDVSEYAAGVAREQFGMDVRAGSLTAAPFGDAEFDIVVMWDIIEHLLDPVTCLKEVSRVLKPGGYLFASTDDAAHWLPLLLGSKWWSIAPPLHLCHFSKGGMRSAIRRAGGLETLRFEKDTRSYAVAEVVEHFGLAYDSRLLKMLAERIGPTHLGRWTIEIARPEQYITVVRKVGGSR